MAPNSESKNGPWILGPELIPKFGAKTEPSFNKILEPCFQNENEPNATDIRPTFKKRKRARNHCLMHSEMLIFVRTSHKFGDF